VRHSALIEHVLWLEGDEWGHALPGCWA